MAFTSTQLAALEAAYAAGVTVVKHGDKVVQYASLDDLWDAILRVRRGLQSSANRYQAGVVRFRSPR